MFALRLPLLCSAAAFLLAFPSVAADGVHTGLALCAHAVVPALFPFAVLSPLLADAVHAAFPQAAAKASILTSFVLGMLTGFPIGALSVISAYQRGHISKNTAELWMGICSGTGPAFLVGYVGLGLFQNAAFGWLLVLLQCLSAWLTARIFRAPITPPNATAATIETKKSAPTSLFLEVGNAALKMLSVCSFIVFFSVVRAFFSSFVSLGVMPQALAWLVGGILEMTGGIADAATIGGDMAWLLSAFFVGFGGICVYGQVGLFAKKAGLSMRCYFLQKCLCGGLCALGMMLICVI